ncbi:hypothetical protein [Hymenobacter sp. AT01-02]|uniref:hypothetical protein n=1 Tax=Hymenobacter sp. AT01-02 TaxID=1571877 RepID=UPI0006E45B55|nr:hypothetical protein [Hymenobacter sp. AT01-02]
MGSLVTNPAGLGLYVKSDISFTPGYSQTTSKTQTGAANLSDTRSSLNIGNFGIAFTNRLPDDDNTSEWRSGTFAFGITRLNDFNQRYRYRNTTTDNRSLFQRFREPRVSYDDIDNEFQTGYTSLDGLAYGTYLSEFVGTPPNDALVLTPRNGEIVQEETVQTSGAQTQFDFGYGASFRDKLYIGGALGIVSTRYNETRDFTETENDPSTPFTSLLRRNTLETQGTGVNFRLGLIYRPTDMVRLGASVQTPTFSKLTDSYGASLRTNFSEEPFPNTGTSRAESTAPGEYSYNLTTPFRATGGAAVILGKYGFVTGDVEYVNYSQARLNGDGSDSGAGVFDVENEAVSNTYGSAVNFRGGVEGRFDVFRVRAGFAHNGDPFKTSTFNRAQNYFTGGLGLYQRNVYIDLAGVYNTDDSYTSAYTLASGLQPVIGVKTNRFTTSVTVGVNF